MRSLTVAALVLLALPLPVLGDETRIDVGDPPRTYLHFLNAREAAMCRASAATGDIEAYFLNPACASGKEAVVGTATLRFGGASRDYLSADGVGLDSSDGYFLFSQFAAVKRSDTWAFGFGYSSPSYRSLEITGRRDSGSGAAPYEGEFTGGLRFFEVLLATRMGEDGRAGVGVAGGIVSTSESTREVLGQSLDSGEVSGSAASIAGGVVYEVTDRVRVGAGYRWGSTIDVSGDWYREEVNGTSKTQPTAVAGLTVQAASFLTVHASYLYEGWDSTESTLADYPDSLFPTEVSEIGEAIGTAALGLEGTLLEGNLVLRAGASAEVASDMTEGAVPEYAVGVGASYAFGSYAAEAAWAREQFAVDGESGEIVTNDGYLTVAYRF